MPEKSLKKNAFLNSFRTFLSLCFPLITFPYSSRILGPDNLGKVNFAQSVVSYFAIIASLGISTYATREAAKVRNDKNQLSRISMEIFTINMIATVVSYILLGLSFLFIKKLAYYKELIIICSTLIMFTTIGMGWLYQAVEDYFYITVRSIIFQVISVILLFVMVKDRDDYLQYAAINIISNVGANICNFVHARKYISFKGIKNIELKKHLKPIFILFAAAVASTVFSSIDTTMLGFMSSDMEVGLYSAGVKIIRMVQHLFPAVFAVIFPRISYYVARKDDKSIRDLSEKTVNAIICFALPITVGLILLMNPLVLLFCGEQYQSSVIVSKIMAPYIIVTALSNLIGGNINIAYGKEKIQLYVITAGAVFDIILNSILIPRYGAYGAALATLLTETGILIFDCIYQRQLIKSLSVKKSSLQFILATAVMAVIVYILRILFDNLWIQLLVPTVAGILIYALVLFLLKNKFFIAIVHDFVVKLNSRFNRKSKEVGN